jgi:2-succinyl-6-hydroxy-2,4-cyclohexadiene-1-carboxylate synthase
VLHADTAGTGSPVVLVHGFTQTGASWQPIAAELARRHRVVCVDLPGHGRSADVRADLWGTARLVGAVGGRAAYVGYSMGGRLALHLALRRPDLVSRLVLLGATGGIDDPAERVVRRAADETLANTLQESGVEAFLDRWLASPLFERLSSEDAGVEHRLANTADGLASSLRLTGTGQQEPLWDRLGAIGTAGIPVLVVAGALDDKFRALGERLVAAMGSTARLALVDDAGHAAHLERPDLFLEIVEPFLRDDR